MRALTRSAHAWGTDLMDACGVWACASRDAPAFCCALPAARCRFLDPRGRPCFSNFLFRFDPRCHGPRPGLIIGVAMEAGWRWRRARGCPCRSCGLRRRRAGTRESSEPQPLRQPPGCVYFPKKFAQYPSHQIFEHVHRILNTVEKNN